jgi:hypothetical protein
MNEYYRNTDIKKPAICGFLILILNTLFGLSYGAFETITIAGLNKRPFNVKPFCITAITVFGSTSALGCIDIA